ncbi:serine hydrolase [Hydrogenophaga sp.]|uniref:serine hydrolase n=1 Tax=Hydrogenophaga sp. TaxID=1904254 RepID=UPI002613F4A4|nr:serine hydrolase [Hydrogenophaga sp.]MCW5654728.1 D-alanyl-D-alanine carboxypeptidase [Hydrogenophaga sp.]
MVKAVGRIQNALLGATLVACLTWLGVPQVAQAASNQGKTKVVKSQKKVPVAKKSTQREKVAQRKDVSRKSPVASKSRSGSAKVAASSKAGQRVKVQMAGGKATTMHAVSVKRKPETRQQASVVRAAIQHRPSVGESLGLREKDDALEFNSSVALVIDQETNEVLFSKNDSAVLPIASLTKLMTGLVIADANLDMNESITITSDDIDTVKGSRSRLAVGTTLSRGEMMHLALMSSENRAAHALGRTYPGGLREFVRLMNQKAASLGMADTHYVEPTGLSSDNRSSARDLATLVSVAYERPILRNLSTSPGYEVDLGRRTLQYINSNRLIRNSDWDIGLQKTGYISEAGRCLVMQAKVAGRQLIMVFLDSAGKLARVQDAERVRRWVELHNGPRATMVRHQPQG